MEKGRVTSNYKSCVRLTCLEEGRVIDRQTSLTRRPTNGLAYDAIDAEMLRQGLGGEEAAAQFGGGELAKVASKAKRVGRGCCDRGWWGKEARRRPSWGEGSGERANAAWKARRVGRGSRAHRQGLSGERLDQILCAFKIGLGARHQRPAAVREGEDARHVPDHTGQYALQVSHWQKIILHLLRLGEAGRRVEVGGPRAGDPQRGDWGERRRASSG